jgi:hypothetical protein
MPRLMQTRSCKQCQQKKLVKTNFVAATDSHEQEADYKRLITASHSSIQIMLLGNMFPDHTVPLVYTC